MIAYVWLSIARGIHLSDRLNSARAKTGSGKTIAYLLPVLQSILRRKIVCDSFKNFLRRARLVLITEK